MPYDPAGHVTLSLGLACAQDSSFYVVRYCLIPYSLSCDRLNRHIKLLATLKIHPIFHILLLELAKGNTPNADDAKL